MGRRVVGLLIAVGAAVITGVIYYLVPYNVKFPAIILAVPLVAAVGGLFQVITGMTLLEANASLPSFPLAKKLALASLALFLLVLGIFAFLWFVVEMEQ